MTDKWGVGNKAADKAFDQAIVGKQTVDLIFGEHPHSRSDNNVYARYPDGRIEEFDGHRTQVRVDIETHNYLKSSHLSGNEIRRGGTGRIFFNGRQVFEFFFRDPSAALDRARTLLGELLECPARLQEPDAEKKLIGRKIYYRETPAVITAVILSQGCVIVRPDTKSGLFPQPVWAEPGDEPSEEAKVEVIDPHLWWWRREDGPSFPAPPNRNEILDRAASANDRLASALETEKLADLAFRARSGEFSDFGSPHATPKMMLVKLLEERKASQALMVRVMSGEFDG